MNINMQEAWWTLKLMQTHTNILQSMFQKNKTESWKQKKSDSLCRSVLHKISFPFWQFKMDCTHTWDSLFPGATVDDEYLDFE